MTSAAHRTLPPVNTYSKRRSPSHGPNHLLVQDARTLGKSPRTTHLTTNQQQKQASNFHDAYNIKQQPKYYLRDKYDNRVVPHQNGNSNSQTPRSTGHNQNNGNDAHPFSLPNQTPNPLTSADQNVTVPHLLSPSQADFCHSIQPLPNFPTKLSLSTRGQSGSHSDNSYESNSTPRRNHPLVGMQKNKFSLMQRRVSRLSHGNNSPMNGKHPQSQGASNSSSDGRDSDAYKSGASVKQSRSIPNHRLNREGDVETEDNFTSFDENNQELRPGDQPRGRASFPETTRQFSSSLPPVRRGQNAPHYTFTVSHPLAPGHPLRGRYSRNGGHSTDRHSPPHRNSDVRRDTIRSQDSADNDLKEEGADGSKQRSLSKVREAQYSKQALSTDSYLENQRRRAVRDSQGYYFPYKKYTLRDYKDLQKSESQFNPFGSSNGTDIDRKALVKKRMQYAAQIEKPSVDTSGEAQRSPRDIHFRKPPYLNQGPNPNPDKAAKRNRALEYVKVQVAKHRPNKSPKRERHRPDPTEEYINSLFPEVAEIPDDDNDDDYENVHKEERHEVHTETSQNDQDHVNDDDGPK